MKAILRTAGVLLVIWGAALALELAFVGALYRARYVASWEWMLGLRALLPVLLGAAVPAAVAIAAIAEWMRTLSTERLRGFVAMVAAGFAVVIGAGVTEGRHFQSLAVRIPFVAMLALAAFLIAGCGSLRLRHAMQIVPARVAIFAHGVASLLWAANAFVLPRLYPAFHGGLFALTALALALMIPALSSVPLLPWLGGILGAGSIALMAPSATRLRTADNLRRTMLETAPLLGRAVEIANRISPAENITDGAASVQLPGEIPRSLDWSKSDFLLISIDALRADHLGAYGYARAKTPVMDGLAREGALAEFAYCPTPHTSYSVTSMMTGKSMKPLMHLGLGLDSETWATHVRHYGVRTAAFYPPAVFFIDPERFATFRDRKLDFEYAKIEFAEPEKRATQLARYLAGVPEGVRVFTWVHLFEPHEPYVRHPGYDDFPPGSEGDYDSEIAFVDHGVQAIVEAFRALRPKGIVILTADHGEEFGDHGGSYHGTSVYEEQIHVPLIVVGPGVPAGLRIAPVVQTIDLLPTVLSAMGIPRPARIVGRDLGPQLKGNASDDGLAYAEVDSASMIAKGTARLVCTRPEDACALFDVKTDPHELRDRGAESPERVRELRALRRSLFEGLGRYEQGTTWPPALLRGMEGDLEAAMDVAALLEDARADVRTKAAEVLFHLRARATLAALSRARTREDSPRAQAWMDLARVRMDINADLALAASHLEIAETARWAALALAERGDRRGEKVLLATWSSDAGTFSRTEFAEWLAAFEKLHLTSAVPALLATFESVASRPDRRAMIAETLGKLGDARARSSLLRALSGERYLSARAPEARALVALGAREELTDPLRRFAGLPQPMEEAIELAERAGILTHDPNAYTLGSVGPRTLLSVPGPARLVIEMATAEPIEVQVGGERASDQARVRVHSIPIDSAAAQSVQLPEGTVRAWAVPRSQELPPPPPEHWDAGTEDP